MNCRKGSGSEQGVFSTEAGVEVAFLEVRRSKDAAVESEQILRGCAEKLRVQAWALRIVRGTTRGNTKPIRARLSVQEVEVMLV